MLNKKHNIKAEKKDKRKGFEREQDRKPKQEKGLIKKKHFVTQYFDVLLFMKQNPRRKRNKERDKNKEPKAKNKDKKEGRKKRTRERQRKRK